MARSPAQRAAHLSAPQAGGQASPIARAWQRLGAWARRAARPSAVQQRLATVEEVEPRILYAADLNPALWAADAPNAQWLVAPAALQAQVSTAADQDTQAEAQTQARRREIVFIDAGITDADQLVQAWLSQQTAQTDREWISIEAGRDGLQQITDVLARTEGIDALHIISHGAQGQLQLGSTIVDGSLLHSRQADVQAWRQALHADADLLLWGCDVGAGDVGAYFLRQLAELTGADVAASNDTTGAAALGGNWNLEQRTGDIAVASLVNEHALASFSGTLATFNVTNLNNSGAGSLRQAIVDANANGGADTIAFGLFGTINLNSALPQITGQISINGSNGGVPGIVINGGGLGAYGLDLTAGASNSQIRGLVLNSFFTANVRVVGASNVTIAGNFIGINPAGTAATSSNGTGIELSNAANTVIGGTAVADRNIISGNSNIGVSVSGAGSSGTVIQGNRIGTNAAGTGDVGNVNHGIYLDDTSGITIGGTTAGAGNLISGNNGSGIVLSATASSIVVQGNTVGLNAAGTGAIANSNYGLWIQGANNTVGGTSSAARNIISGNDAQGVYLNGAAATGNTVLGNYIGTRADGIKAHALDNGVAGISLDNGASSNTIGGTASGTRNIIAGNNGGGNINGGGLTIDGTSTNNNQILGNWIGMSADGTTSGENTYSGIRITGATGTVIGDGTAAGRNLIARNSLDGISLNNAIGTLIRGNWIIYNQGDGIQVSGASSSGNVIGGTTFAGGGNLISHNSQEGVNVDISATASNAATVLANAFYQNGNSGINLGPGGSTLNDAGDSDSGANGLQNYPVLTSATSNPSGSTFAGTLNSTANTTFRIDFYASPPGSADHANGEGTRWMGSTTVTTNGSGNASFNTTFTSAWFVHADKISATASRDLGGGTFGGTSEFSANITGTASGVLVVDTMEDNTGGSTSSITNLANSRGLDSRISLREAITAANNTANGASPDLIVISIPPDIESLDFASANLAPTISLGSLLPAVTQALTLQTVARHEYAGSPLVRLDAGAALTFGLQLNAGSAGSAVRGLAITGFSSAGINISSSNNNTIAGNYIGLTVDGTTVDANGNGISITNSSSTVIGTNADGNNDAAETNVISGNANGIVITGASSSSNLVQGNLIGTDATGLLARGNTFDGIRLENGANNNTIGGAGTVRRNVISGNGQEGVQIDNETSDGNTIRGNWIGVNAAGTGALGTGGVGIFIVAGADNTFIGGNGADDGNWIASPGIGGIEIEGASTGTVIQGNRIGTDLAGTANWGAQQNAILLEGTASNTTVGVHSGAGGNVLAFSGQGGSNTPAIRVLSGSTGNAIFGNTIIGGPGLSLDLDTAGVTSNDAAPDADTGANNLQNFPVLTAATTNGSGLLTVTGTLTSALSTPYRIHFYSSSTVHGSGAGPAANYLGYADVTTNGAGTAAISTMLSANVAPGHHITASATRSNVGFSTFTDTSEFAASITTTAAAQFTGTVDTASDVADGDTSNWANLMANRGADGFISLREAITASNNTANGSLPDRITFAIAGTGVHTINVGSALPAITDALVLDATTDDSFAANANRPAIVLDGNDGLFHGLVLSGSADGSTIQGLVIRDFMFSGISVQSGSDNHIIVGNYLGALSSSGQFAAGEDNGANNLSLEGSGATVGGTTAAQRNVISGAGNSGIRIAGSNNTVVGNYIGLAADGTTVIGNSWDGITVSSGSGNSIGGTGTGEGNRIAGSGDDAIEVSSGSANALLGNIITASTSLGIDLGGNNDTPTANDAGDSDTGSNNLQNFPVLTTARTNASNQLVISGTLNSEANSHYRIEFYSNAAQDGSGHGEGQTYLGHANVATDGSGNATINATLAANVALGSFISATATRSTDGSFTSFTDTSEFARNISTVSSTQATVTVDTTSDNADGDTTSFSTLLASKGADGYISLREAITAANNQVNGVDPDRILFAIAGTGAHTITPLTALPTITDAVVLDASTDDSFAANGNRPAIVLDGNDLAAPGLELGSGADGSTIRGFLIRDFAGDGIAINAGSDGNIIVGNYIGSLLTDGSSAGSSESNSQAGIYVSGANNIIGGLTAAERNVLAGNDIGIHLDGATASGNQVLGNYIGTDATGTLALGNTNQGINVGNSANGNIVGGTVAGHGNLIAYNGSDGIRLLHSGTINIAILGNSVHANGSDGIDLAGDGVSANDTDDVDSGPNNLQNFPLLAGAITDGVLLTISGHLNSEASSHYRIEFFANPSGDASGHGEGQAYLGFAEVSTDAGGYAAFAASFAAVVPAGRAISATATKATDASYGSYASTSEFSANVLSLEHVAPSNTVPGGQSTAEDTSRVFSSANGNAVTISDSDAGLANNQVTLSVTNGTLTLAGTAGLSFASGDGTTDASMVVRGTAAAINTALNGLSYTPAADYNGGAVLTISTKDSVLLSLDIDAGLLGRYAFDNAGNLGLDSSPAGANAAALMNSPAAVTDGSRGQVVELDGNSGLQAAGVLGGPVDVTLAAWVNLTAADSFGAEVISLGGRISLRLDQAGQLYGQHFNGSTFEGLGYTATLAGTGWRHVAFTFDDANNTRTLYLDGIAVAGQSTSDSVDYAGASSTVIGRDGAGGTSHDFSGHIDELRIYNRALTPAEIAALADDLALVVADTVAISVTAVNDAPELADTALTLTVAEDAGAPSGTVGSLISAYTGGISDGDLAATTGIAITGTVESNGSWYYTTNNGTNWTAVAAVSNTSALLLADNASTRLYFQPNSNYAGTSSGALTLRAWDQTTGSVGTKVSTASNGASTAFSSATDSVGVTVTAVNDAPVNTLPGAQSTEISTVLNLGGARALSVADVDATLLRVSLGITNGTLTLTGTAGLSFTSGDGTADTAMVFTGSIATINAALDGMSFVPNGGFQGAAVLSITTNDLGSSGSGGPLSDTDTLEIQVGAKVFQQGAAGYAGTVDTYVAGFAPAADYSATSPLLLDGGNAGDAILLRFGALFGNGVGQVPAGSTVTSATMSFYVTQTSFLGSLSLHRMLSGWAATSTFNSLGSGVQDNGTEADAMPLVTFSSGNSGWHIVYGLESLVQGWADGASNNGFAFMNPSGFLFSGWGFASSEDVSAEYRPYLAINYIPPQPAVVTASGGQATFTENGAAVAVDPGLVLSDADSPQLTGATVAFTAGYAPGQDSLAFTNQAGITASWNSGSGVLTLSGTASVAQYQAALRSVTYSNNSDAPSTASRTLRFTVQDAWVSSTSDSRNVWVTAVNDAPLLVDTALSLTVAEDAGPPSGAVGAPVSAFTGGASDVDTGASRGIAITGSVETNGSWHYSTDGGANWALVGTVDNTSALLLADNASSRLYFAPAANFNGSAAGALSLRAWDQSSGSAGSRADASSNGGTSAFSSTTDVIDVLVTAVNDVPVLASASLTLVEGLSPTLAPANFSIADPDDSSFVYTISGVSGGYFQLSSAAGTAIASFTSAQLAGGLVQFVDDGDELAPAFSVKVNDGDADSNVLAATINYTPANDAPVFTAASLSLDEGQVLSLVPGHFSVTDPDDTSFDYTVSGISGGYFQLSSAAGTSITSFTSAQLAAGLVQFVDDGDEVAPGFSIRAHDGDVDSNVLAAAISYTPLNDAPVVTAASLTLSEGQTVTLAPGNFSFTDPDDADFSFTVSGVSGGHFQLGSAAGTPITTFTTADLAAGLVQFVHNGEEAAPAFSVRVNDGDVDSNVLAATINYTPVNEAPLVTAASLTLSEGQVVTLAAGNFAVTDPDDSSFTYTVSSVGGAYFQLDSAAGTPITSFSSADLASGLVQLVDDGDEVAPAFSVSVNDGDVDSNVLAATIHYTPVNDGPVVTSAGLNLNEGQTVTLAGGHFGIIDPDNASFDYRLSGVSGAYFQLGSAPGTPITSFTSADLANGLVQLVDDGDEVAPAFSIRVHDGAVDSNVLAATINYLPVNDAPVVVAAGLTLSEGQTVTLAPGNFAVADPDDGSFNYNVHGVSGGHFQLSSAAGTPIFSFTSAQLAGGLVQFVDDGDEAAPAFSLRVNDGDVDSNVLAATINYTTVNDAPVVGVANLTLSEGETVTLASGNFGVTDPDNGSFVYTIIGVSGGYFQLSGAAGTAASSFTSAELAAGLLQFVDDGDEAAPAFSIRVHDGAVDSNVLAATIHYSPVNDAPVVNAASLNLSEAQTVTLAAGNFGINDPDSSSLVYTVSGVNGGYFQIGSAAGAPITSFTSADLAAGLLQFVDDGDETAPAFSVRVSDGQVDSNTLAASITYTPVNDAPAISAADLSLGEGQTVTLTPGNFSIIDPDHVSFQFTASGISGGYLQLSSAAGTPITTFNSLDLARGVVQFVDDGDEVRPAFSIQVADGEADTPLLAVDINYQPANDAPVLNLGSTLFYTENQSARAVNPGIILSDADNPTLAAATVQITGNYQSGADELRFTSTPGTGNIVGTWNGGTGQLQLLSAGASATATQWQSALRAVAYLNTSDHPTTLGRTVSFTVNDGALDSNSVASTVQVLAVNDVPAVLNISAGEVYFEDRLLDLTDIVVLDPDSLDVTVSLTLSDPAAGLLAAAPAGATVARYDAARGIWSVQGLPAEVNASLALLSFQPATNFAGSLSIAVSVSDGDAAPVTGSKVINGRPVNDAPAGSVMLLGMPAQGQTIVADPRSVFDPDGLGSLRFQWLRDGVPIATAVSDSYTLGADDIGSQIAAAVTWTDGQGFQETLTSATTERIARGFEAELPQSPGPSSPPGYRSGTNTSGSSADAAGKAETTADADAGLLQDLTPRVVAPLEFPSGLSIAGVEADAAGSARRGSGLGLALDIQNQQQGPRRDESPTVQLMSITFEWTPLDGPAGAQDAAEAAAREGLRVLARSPGAAGPDAAEADSKASASDHEETQEPGLISVLNNATPAAGIGVTATALWWLTRSGGLLTSMLMGVPAWRHVDLLPVLSSSGAARRQAQDDAEDSDTRADEPVDFDDSAVADLFMESAFQAHEEGAR